MPFSKKARCYEFLASPGGIGEPPPRDSSGALYSDVIAALSHLT
jgi:hypothetical protein